MRLRLAEELHLSKDLADLRQIHPVEKCRIVSEVRFSLGLEPYSQIMRAEVELWIAEKIAREEGDFLSLVNAAIRWFR